MPHVIIKMHPGNSEEKKIQLTEEITQAIMSVINKPEMSISVDIQEIGSDTWMDEVYAKDIQPKMDSLYKKPGY